jgi:hypothetical protein
MTMMIKEQIMPDRLAGGLGCGQVRPALHNGHNGIT